MKNIPITKTVFLVLAIFLLSQSASAATRTVLVNLKIADNRTDCPDDSETGARRPCDDGNNVWATGHLYEVWDRDDVGDDEYIGRWIFVGQGTNRITFEWEGASYSNGEANPDVYIKYINKVRNTDIVGARVTAVDTDGSSHPVISWRSSAVAWNCTTGSDCDMAPGAVLIPRVDPTTDIGQRVLALDSSQHALEAVGSKMDQDVNMHYPGSSATTSFATSQTEFHINEFDADEGMVAPHEVGHVLQMQQFGQDFLRNNCNLSGAGHGLTTTEYESCSTTEGFADYISAVSWYEPNLNIAPPTFEPKTFFGFQIEDPVPNKSTCSDNGAIELQVAKAFWDIDDWNDEAGEGAALGKDDNDRLSTTWIAGAWDNFADGTSDREDYETGDNGVNVKDYFFNNETFVASSTFGETIRGHNCLQFQEKF